MTVEPVIVRRRLAAPPERVWRAWTDPALLARWMSPVGHAEAVVDLRVGGRLVVTMVGEGRRIEHQGEWLELDPPHRLAFTWSSPYTGGVATRVTVRLEADRGGTAITLRHELLPSETVASHASGWTLILDRLAALVLEPDQQEVPRGAG